MVDVAMVATVVGALATGGVLTAVWNSVFPPRRDRTSEAEAIQQLGADIRREIREENEALRLRMDVVVNAVISLTDLLDDLFPKITGLSEEERIALRHKINLAKRAT
ncbi:membrane protein [Mycobacterium phage Reindeer]|uniref:Membrane protein n=1 Tax=Mycobacterium phage Reindeer TaxID=2762283 RepID=A0A7G8LHX1_9CAUD|nr:membrane protein [Mycobacterium phage Reindeer]QNJ56843.1 membrane protein [Mycobacterium phage Reindeer]